MAIALCTVSALVPPASSGSAQGPESIPVATFSAAVPGEAAPEGWTPLTFKKIPKHTHYVVVREQGQTIVKATSQASASGLTKAVTIDPKEYPIVRWRWRVENVLQKSDMTRKDGDDYPARLYITFLYEPDRVSFGRKLKYQAGRALFGDIPIAALNYVWESRAPVGTIIDNAFTDFAKMVVVQSGSQHVGAWVEQERNVYEDYRQAFGGEPPMISGVAIMTDTDNTGEQATAYYGDIVFVKAGATPK
ncbi:MAG: DUF3047 domain-containing protein [Nitrospiraceae bacterium]|nr:DUF3047 domain-containing protein [Nitrospiraceae bacterium]